MESLKHAIELMGGVTQLAKALGVSQQNVSNWLMRGRVPVDPVNQVLAIERVTGGKVTRHQLRPDVYPVEEAA